MGKDKHLNPKIRNSANMSSSIRQEIQKQGEHFEKSTTSSRSVIATTTSTLSSRSMSSKMGLKIMKEEVHTYDNHLVSTFDRTDDTRSFQSMPDLTDLQEVELEKKAIANTKLSTLPVIPVQYTNMTFPAPLRAEMVSDYDLCLLMEPNGKAKQAQAMKVDHFKRFDAELAFCEQMVKHVEGILAAKNRMDIEVRVVKSRDKNHMPRCQIQLIRKIESPKKGEHFYGIGVNCDEPQQQDGGGDGVRKDVLVDGLPTGRVGKALGFVKGMFGFSKK